MISIVCVYNDRQILDDYLMKGLRVQTAPYELVLVDNTSKRFKSAADALNYGGMKATQKHIMFVHQDVVVEGNEWLFEAERTLGQLERLGVAGVAGKMGPLGVKTNLTHGIDHRRAGTLELSAPVVVQTVDECLFFVARDVFRTLKFDETTCSDWHLYAVDYCLSVSENGLNVYALPLNAYHRSPGYSMSEEFYSTLEKVIAKHRKYHPSIFTSMGDWSTRYPVWIQRFCFRFSGIAKKCTGGRLTIA